MSKVIRKNSLPYLPYGETWVAAEVYNLGDVVRQGAVYYRSAIDANTGSDPSVPGVDWVLLDTSANYGQPWDLTAVYVDSDVVLGSDDRYYRLVIATNQGVDPVAGVADWYLLPAFDDAQPWVATVSYAAGDRVRGSDDEYYESRGAANLNNDPATTAGEFWEIVSERQYGANWNQYNVYAQGDFAREGTVYYESLTNGNVGQLPSANPGAWLNAGIVSAAIGVYPTEAALAAASLAIGDQVVVQDTQYFYEVVLAGPGVFGVTLANGNTAAPNILNRSGRKNGFINGAFDEWQRGTTTTSANAYLADRWEFATVVDSGGAVSTATDRLEFAPGQIEVPFNPKYYAQIAGGVNAGGGAESVLYRQKIESVLTLSGETATISFWAKAASNRVVNLDFRQSFGGGGVPSPDVFGSIGAVNITTTWQKFVYTFAVPSISGKTLGTAGDDLLEIAVVLQAGAGSDYTTTAQDLALTDIANVQIERGPRATDFEITSRAELLALCQRYYQIFSRVWLYVVALQTVTSRQMIVPRVVTMRAAPTETAVINNGSLVLNGLADVLSISANGLTDGQSSQVTLYTADAEL